MKIAVPREVKDNEYRVAITPAGVRELVAHGHDVAVETQAGVGSSITDAEFVAAGARILPTADDVWARITAGATLVQGYTGFIYGGPLWPRRIHRGLSRRLAASGLPDLRAAIGRDVDGTRA